MKSIEVIRRGKVHPVLAAQALDGLAVNDLERELELVHLVLPLMLQRGRADDEDAADALTREQFLHHQSGFDSLAQAHVVGDEQVDARHEDGASDWLKLVVVELNGRAEWGLNRWPFDNGRG